MCGLSRHMSDVKCDGQLNRTCLHKNCLYKIENKSNPLSVDTQLEWQIHFRMIRIVFFLKDSYAIT